MDQTEQMLADGGMLDEGGGVEGTSGNNVPPGSLKEEVADQIDAKLSPGEFVFPADVVRFIGLEKLMKMRDMAKKGLARMEEMGQFGNADDVENPDQLFSESDEDAEFESEIDDIMSEME